MRLAALGVAVLVLAGGRVTPPPREVAVTIDDLPVAGLRHTPAENRTITTKLLGALAAHHVPAIGFVNESKLEWQSETLLQMWLDRGFELGNHTFSHLDFHDTPLDRYEDDVVKGDPAIRRLMQRRGRVPRFFRHPFLHTGRDLETRAAFERFLADRGYRVAPVTIDNDDYIFARAYDKAFARGDRETMRRVAAAYVPYMNEKFSFFERNAEQLFGRDIRQILLIHASLLNGDEFGRLAAMMTRRGYRFITLERALEDDAFKSPDTYVGPSGITWLHRWALTRGVNRAFYKGEPDVPKFVADNAR